MKVYLIARVSTLEQIDSLPAQVYRLKEYAERKSFKGYELFEIQESAYGSNRENFRQIIDTVTKQNDLCILVFDKIDRYTRNSNSDEVTLLNSLCRLGQLELHFPSDSLFISKSSSAQEHLMLNIGISSSQYYSDAISDNTRRGNQQKWRDGRITGPAPFGYINKQKEDGTKWVFVEPLKAHAVKEAFKMYASGNHSIKEIGKKWRIQYGFSVSNSRIAKILQSPFYCGQLSYLGVLYPHHYEAIISEELFEKAQLVRESRGKKSTRWYGLPYPYRSLIECADCGCKITFEQKKQKYIYGHCTQSKGKHGAKYVNENALTKVFAGLFIEVKLPDHVYDDISQKLRAEHEATLKDRGKAIKAIESEIAKYDLRLERMYDDYLDSKIDEALYEKKSKEAKAKRKRLVKRQTSFELSVNNDYGSKLHLLKLARDAPKLFKKANFEQKRALINKVLSNLRLDGNLLRSEFKDPFDLIVKCNKTENWYPREESNLYHLLRTELLYPLSYGGR